jgi:hypothetical protein
VVNRITSTPARWPVLKAAGGPSCPAGMAGTGGRKCLASPIGSDDGKRTNSLLGCRAFASLVHFASKRKRLAESANS